MPFDRIAVSIAELIPNSCDNEYAYFCYLFKNYQTTYL